VALVQAEEGPTIVLLIGKGFIVITLVTLVTPHALVTAYVITVVPEAMPVTVPVAEPILAFAGLLLVHRPPAVPSLSVMLDDAQTPAGPLIAGTDGSVITDMVRVALQPELTV
jgi:hypothetical protein